MDTDIDFNSYQHHKKYHVTTAPLNKTSVIKPSWGGGAWVES